MTDSNEDDVSFSDEIDEETIERVRSEHGDVENMKTYLPFKRQTYTELVLALVGGFFVYAFAYITIPFILGIQNEVFAGETVRAVHHRRHVAGASAFFCGLYYVLVTARAYGIPVFNFFIGLLISLVVPSIIHS
ncbi:MAG: hypothetical protein SV760_04880, partial [Halobacteria archaeon]|nr:hypothetical protein [Halobacteria archaeon]